MRKLLIIGMLIIGCEVGFSQETNKELLEKAKVELNTAVENENYEAAARFKKEVQIRQEIEISVAKGDFETAAKLKKQLEVKSTREIDVADNDEVNLNLSTAKTTMGFLAPQNGKAAVYFVRYGSMGLYMRMNVFDDNALIGGATGASYIRYECEPGDHLFWLWFEKNEHKSFLSANLEPNKTYIIEIDATATSIKERKLSGKENYNYSLYLQPLYQTDTKKFNKFVSLIKKKSSKSYPESVIKRLNSEYEYEIRETKLEFQKINQAELIKLMPDQYIKNEYLGY